MSSDRKRIAELTEVNARLCGEIERLRGQLHVDPEPPYVEFFAPGNPRGWARPRACGKRFFTDPQDAAWREVIAVAALPHRPAALFDCACRATLQMQFAPPMSWSRPRRQDALGKFKWHKPDQDNLCKAVFDATEGIVFTNDSRIAEVRMRKIYSRTPGVHVRIEAVPHEGA